MIVIKIPESTWGVVTNCFGRKFLCFGRAAVSR